jgi:hypothetical protein
MNGNGGMKSSSWVIIACMIILALLGGASFFLDPKYGYGVLAVLTTISAVLTHQLGSVSGSTLPEQLGEPKPGQTATTDTHTESAVPPNPPAPDQNQ